MHEVSHNISRPKKVRDSHQDIARKICGLELSVRSRSWEHSTVVLMAPDVYVRMLYACLTAGTAVALS